MPLSFLPKIIAPKLTDLAPELLRARKIRLLMLEGMDFEQSFSIAQRTFSYTNHTVMSEALERWPESLFAEQLPRIYMILQEMNKRLCAKLWDVYPGQWERIGHMAILAYDQAHMANMCIAYSHAVNGVSQLHGEILKRSTFADYYKVMPEKFCAITNGITPRRWLMLANPGLSALLDESIGQGWRKDTMELEKLLPLADDAAFVEKFAKVKHENKARFSRWINRHQGLVLDPDTMFDVQVKRLHEYKRQLMNALSIVDIYFRLKDGEIK